ncbi:restriction endonuclease subunit S [Chryseobacterium profundimaris]|uniref:Type I restriction enzyme, S subunit n=1 Tax=Chryseobacterium profundimaris TaxID=1387275 RepID=A0ABY1NEM0_9FLAO|nr:restriction endonuclease subunit S [Chryseobacterium profundimaris]SMP07709.1 type I restriction enzyme, S subunit [Chryseobacterium profundimaris]
MNEEITLIPELRFPEFIDDGDWEKLVVSQVASYENGKAHEQNIVEEGAYIVVNSKFISSDGKVRKYTDNANCLANKDDVLMVLSDVPNGKAIAKCFYVEENNKFTVNQRICKITATKVNSKILYYVLNRNSHLLSFDDGVKQTNLRNEDVLNCPVLLPKNPKEQAKISEFVSSLDEIIEGHIERLDLLEEHKKGLMQNLFPQKGEKKPKHRFPEFENDGEWIQTSLGNVYRFYITNSFSRDNLNYEAGNVKNIHYGDIHTKFSTLFDITNEYVPFINEDISIDKIKEDSYCIEGDIVFADASEDMNDIGKSIEIVNLDGQKLVSGLHTLLARQKKSELAIGFGGYLFKSAWIRRQIQRESQGAKVLGISATRISEILISFPKNQKEQKKIAACLFALDELIIAQTKKIDQLRLHKKGLMQSLFPKMND